MHRMTRAAVALSGLLALVACAAEPPNPTFPVTFVARADRPLAGVAIAIEGGARLGTTGDDGILRVTLSGREGTMVPFRVACPDGYRAPRAMPAMTLRRFVGFDPAAAARGIRVSIECLPSERMAALVLRAGQPGLPVLARGREVARTDADGVAHALVVLPPNSTFRVVVDTSQRPDLRPESPATTLAVADSDEIFVIDQDFAVELPARPPAPPPRRRHRHKKPPASPPVETAPEPPEPPTLPEKL
jgi:hypothetical protein